MGAIRGPACAAFVALTTSCASLGVLAATRPDPRFVHDEGSAFFSTVSGIERVALDGAHKRLVFAGSWSVHDASHDFVTFVLSNSNTDLFIGNAGTGELREVEALHGRFSEGALSPDGRTVAASRHSDFSLPQEQWRDDDTIYLIDVETLRVRTIAPSSGAWPTRLEWTRDGAAVVAGMAFEAPGQQIVVADGARRRDTPEDHAPTNVFPKPIHAVPTCEGRIAADRFATELRVETPAGVRTLASEIGRKRGFHDYLPDFSEARFTPTCRYVAFGFQGDTWLASASGSGELARLVRGWLLFFAPPFEPE